MGLFDRRPIFRIIFYSFSQSVSFRLHLLHFFFCVCFAILLESERDLINIVMLLSCVVERTVTCRSGL